ncbi:MAG: hypothetical protein GX038_04680 [Erysipelothrix sp.]|nr:hypothetical protein [Erysipelothrix sp.]
MRRNNNVKHLAISGLLTAVAILIPMFMPIKLILPASTYTLASHVPVFIAMFISPQVAVMVALGTTFGFAMTFPPIVALRALSHLIFALPGAIYLKKHKIYTSKQRIIFSVLISILHAIGEFTLVALVSMKGINMSILLQFALFLGLGTFIHSMVDFFIALMVSDTLKLQ